MKTLKASEVQQVSGGDTQADAAFYEWLNNAMEALRRSWDRYVP